MTDHHLANEEFLTRLTTLLSTTHSLNHGSVFLSQKAYSKDSSQILIRVTNGTSKKKRQEDPSAKIKLSTLVEVDGVAAFYQKYSEVCKRGMEGLRKRDKKKGKGKEKARRKGKGKEIKGP